MAFPRASYFITLHSASHLNFFADNTPLSFANVMTDRLLLTSPLGYEIALTDLHVEAMHTHSRGTLLVECNLAAKRQIGEYIGPVIRMLLLAPTASRSPSVDETKQHVEYRWYQCDPLQYHPLDLFVANPLYEVRLTLSLLGEPLEIYASEVFATPHIRRRSDAPPFTQGVKLPLVKGEGDFVRANEATIEFVEEHSTQQGKRRRRH